MEKTTKQTASTLKVAVVTNPISGKQVILVQPQRGGKYAPLAADPRDGEKLSDKERLMAARAGNGTYFAWANALKCYASVYSEEMHDYVRKLSAFIAERAQDASEIAEHPAATAKSNINELLA